MGKRRINACNKLQKLLDEVKKEFLDNEKNLKDFSAACNHQNEIAYKGFIDALSELENIWPEWAPK